MSATVPERDLGAVETRIDPAWCTGLAGGDVTDAGVVLHVIEELYQHLGHMELAADALTG